MEHLWFGVTMRFWWYGVQSVSRSALAQWWLRWEVCNVEVTGQ